MDTNEFEVSKCVGKKYNGKVFIIGIGPGAMEYVIPKALELLENCQVLIGGKRNLELFSNLNIEKLEIGNNLESISKYINENALSKNICIVVSGDPCIYSMTEYLKKNLNNIELCVLPGISSLQYLCTKALVTWNDMAITSVHGREENFLLKLVANNKKVGIFTGGKNSPSEICKKLADANLKDLEITIGENLSYENERIVTGRAEEFCNMTFESLSIMIIENKRMLSEKEGCWNFASHGIPDEYFVRGEVPMTKEEVRSVTISKLRLREDSIVYDVGAGTGSVSIECALICKRGIVYAFEKEEDAIALIEKNKEKFAVGNVIVIEGEAPQSIIAKPAPDRVFIGGAGPMLKDTIDLLIGLKNDIRIVINSITVETTYEALKYLEEKGFENIEIINLQTVKGKKAGSKNMMIAQNPISIISGDFVHKSKEN